MALWGVFEISILEILKIIVENGKNASNQSFLLFHNVFNPIKNKLKHFIETYFLAPLAKGQRAIVMALCPSSVSPSVHEAINFAFTKLLLRNYWLDFYQISQECSLGGPLSNSVK